MTIREFAKLNNFPIKGKLTRIPDEVEYDFNDRPHNCKRYVDEDFNEYGIHEDGFIVAIPCEKAWGFIPPINHRTSGAQRLPGALFQSWRQSGTSLWC